MRRKENQCYVARNGKYYAHGDTLAEAIDSLNFKILSETRDKSEIARDCIEKDKVTISSYRLLTGACLSGTKAHLVSCGIDIKKTQSLTVKEAIAASSGGYGHKQFVALLEAAK